MGEVTECSLKQELEIRPYVKADQAAKLIAKGFKTKVNALRSLGLKVLRTALEELLPAGFFESLSSLADEAAAETTDVAAGTATSEAMEQEKMEEKPVREGSTSPKRSPRSGSRRGRAA